MVNAQSIPVFNGKQLINVTTIPAWDVVQRQPGWYRIAMSSGTNSRANTVFELRENSQHSTLRFELGVSYNQVAGSSLTVTSHSYYNVPAFLKVRLITSTPYADSYLEVYVKPIDNNNNAFNAYTINPLSVTDWQLINWTPGEIPFGYNAVEFDVDKLFSVGNLPNSNILSVARNGYVGIGTDIPKEKLSVNGKIRAKEIKVEVSNWPDYVFDSKYNLESLDELEKFVQINKHLPGMPSAEIVLREGIDLGEMQRGLLKNQEELTLHLIEKSKTIERLEEENKMLMKEQIQVRNFLKKVLKQLKELRRNSN